MQLRPPFTVLGNVPGPHAQLLVIGDSVGKIGVAVEEARRNMADAFSGRPHFVDPSGWPDAVYVPECGAATSESVEFRTRRIDMETFALPQYGCAVRCAFDVVTRNWFVCGPVRAYHRTVK